MNYEINDNDVGNGQNKEERGQGRGGRRRRGGNWPNLVNIGLGYSNLLGLMVRIFFCGNFIPIFMLNF